MKEYSTFPRAPGLSVDLVSYLGHLLGKEESYNSAEMLSAYSTTLADWAMVKAELFLRGSLEQ